MQLLSLPGASLRAHEATVRVVAARTAGVVGVVAYNWWIVVPFVPGLMPSVNGFFSDLEATGRRDASWMSDADIVAGVLLVTALLVRGSHAQGGPRREWKWLVAFAAAGAIGGRFPYACSEGLSASCRQLEWSLQLPVHHYVHVVSGITEFATLTVAAVIAMRRTRMSGAAIAPLYAGLVTTLAIGYPLLGAVYLTDRLGTMVEPIFFIAFSTMVLAEVFESSGHDDDRSASPSASREGRSTWGERVMARDAFP